MAETDKKPDAKAADAKAAHPQYAVLSEMVAAKKAAPKAEK